MLREVLTRCDGLAVNQLVLHNLSYTEQLLNVVEECLPSVTVSELFIDGVSSGHERVHRLPEVITGKSRPCTRFRSFKEIQFPYIYF